MLLLTVRLAVKLPHVNRQHPLFLEKRMQEKKLGRHFTMAGLHDKLDVIECFERPGSKLIVGEVIKKQRRIYRDLDIQPLPRYESSGM